MTSDLVAPVVVVGLDGLDELVEVGAVSGVDLGQGEGRAGLAAHQPTQARFALHDAVGDSHLTAESRQEQHQLEKYDAISAFKIQNVIIKLIV